MNEKYIQTEKLLGAIQTYNCYFFMLPLLFQIDRIIPIAGDEDMLNFSHLFAETSKRNFSDDHLWFSVSVNIIQHVLQFMILSSQTPSVIFPFCCVPD